MTGTVDHVKVLGRCDRCGSRAVMRARLPGDAGELLFCGHHGRTHQEKLSELGALIEVDEEQLAAT